MQGDVSPLSIVVSGPDPHRIRSAVGLAAAHLAAGGAARLFFDAPAVSLLPGLDGTEIGAMLDMALELGVSVTVCQTGMAEDKVEPASLDSRFDYGGLIGFVASADVTRLVLA
jgi:predicted peroxiredoxin